MNEVLTFEQLPNAVTMLTNEVSELKRLLIEKQEQQPETDHWFNLNEFCDYHPDKPKKQTVYGWVQNSLIPVHKGGKKLRFLKSEIDNWIKKGRRKTLTEIADKAEQYLNKKEVSNG